MPTWRYALERGGEKSLTLSFEGRNWKNTEVRLDGELLGSFPDKKAFAAGQAFPLPERSVLHAQFAHRMPVLLRDGVPVPGSATDPVHTLSTSCGILYAIAGLNVVLGLIAWAFPWVYLRSLSYGPVSIAVGLVILVLALLAQRRSVVALLAAIGVAALYMAFVLLSGFVAGAAITDATIPLRWAALMLQYMSVPLGLLVSGLFALIPLCWGVGAINQLKKAAVSPTRAEGRT
jgi:hypothetical protein